VDLPDFVKESVPQIQILCTFQARLARNPVRSQRPTNPAHLAPGEKPMRSQPPLQQREF